MLMNESLFAQQRRDLLRLGVSASTLALVASSGLLLPQRVLANFWPTSAFDAETIEQVLLVLMGKVTVQPGGKQLYFHAKQPRKQVTNGQSVPITVISTLAKVDSLALVVDSYTPPLVMMMKVYEAALPVTTQIKLPQGKTKIHAIVRANGELFETVKTVNVAVGGVS